LQSNNQRSDHSRLKAGTQRAWDKIANLLDRDFSEAGVVCGELRETDLSTADIPEMIARHVLRKKPSQEFVLRDLFGDYGAALQENAKLERCSRRTEFDEELFVRFYPYLPHWIRLSMEISEGIRIKRQTPGGAQADALNMAGQVEAMLTSSRTRFLDQAVGALVTIDRVYDLVEQSIPAEQHRHILEIQRLLDTDETYHAMASRVAKAICMMELVQRDLPRTPRNIAALLIQNVSTVPPLPAVEWSLFHLKETHFVFDTEDGWWHLCDLDDARRAASDLEWLRKRVGTVNARPPGWRNDAIQALKKLLARSLNWYTRPLHEFNAAVTRSVQGAVRAVDYLATNKASTENLTQTAASIEQLCMDVVALKARLVESEKRDLEVRESLERRIELLERQLGAPPAEIPPSARSLTERTTYILGLFGSGRRYVNELLLENLGERGKYFRDTIRLHPGPTPMIYSGHATIKHPSRDQAAPAVMSGISAAIRCGYAHSIFIYRHPLDSLLTNWVWWRTYLRENEWVSGIFQVYKDTSELCSALDENFPEFLAFAHGDPVFFAAQPGPRFLSFSEFVEETELHRQAATLALRFEDFICDPRREFSKVLELMSLNDDPSDWVVAPPKTKAYGYLTVKDQVPSFQQFIDGLDKETRQRMERIGYCVDPA
jgi:hypothetical protein